jgi:hypothetical protein
LSAIRKELKSEIEALEVFGKKVFDVWINEETPPQGDCDIFVALSNGNAGWAKDAGDVGICHAELMTAQRFFERLAQTGEEALVVDRARARARIVRAIAKEVSS